MPEMVFTLCGIALGFTIRGGSGGNAAHRFRAAKEPETDPSSPVMLRYTVCIEGVALRQVMSTVHKDR